MKGKECSVSVGVCGEVDRKEFISRNGAKDGDSIYVSGVLGIAKLGLKTIQAKKKTLSTDEKKYIKKFLQPKVHTKLGKTLRNVASSCIDISDGLLGDLGHICKESNLGAVINIDSIPHKGPFKGLNLGDDYELCFTVPKSKELRLSQICKKQKN